MLSESGRAMMRPLFMDFSLSDPYTLEATEDLKLQYMFGPRLLVSPVTTYRATNATVYLPKLPSDAPDTKWTYWWTNESFDGGQWVSCLSLFFDSQLTDINFSGHRSCEQKHVSIQITYTCSFELKYSCLT